MNDSKVWETRPCVSAYPGVNMDMRLGLLTEREAEKPDILRDRCIGNIEKGFC